MKQYLFAQLIEAALIATCVFGQAPSTAGKNDAKAGTLPAASAKSTIALYDKTGKRVNTIGEAGLYNQLRFSPDGKRLAVAQSGDIWVYDVASGKATQITSTAAQEAAPLWSPDGKKLAYAASRDNLIGLYQKNSDGSGTEETVYVWPFGSSISPTGWTRNGVVYWAGGGATKSDLFLISMTGTHERSLVVGGPSNEQAGQLSQDERWVAFRSDESGKNEIYIRSNKGSEAPVKVSTSGAEMLRWRSDSKALIYLGVDGNFMEVPVASDGKLGSAKAVFKLPAEFPKGGNPGGISDIQADGSHYLFLLR